MAFLQLGKLKKRLHIDNLPANNLALTLVIYGSLVSTICPKGFLNKEMEHRAQDAHTLNLNNSVSQEFSRINEIIKRNTEVQSLLNVAHFIKKASVLKQLEEEGKGDLVSGPQCSAQ